MNDKKRVIIVDDPSEETDHDFERQRRAVKDWHNRSNCVPFPSPYRCNDLAFQTTKYCVFHKDTQLDENELCPDCLEMVKKRTKKKR